MSIIERNIKGAFLAMEEKIAEEKKNIKDTKFVLVQIAYNPGSYELNSIALSEVESDIIPEEILRDKYYNMAFITENLDAVTRKFRDKYLFHMAYSDISFALHAAYKQALQSPEGESIYKTSFFKPSLENSTWAYKDVFEFSDLKSFRCWFNFDDQFEQVEIQTDLEFMKQYDEIQPAEGTKL